jgi:lipoyl synthase
LGETLIKPDWLKISPSSKTDFSHLKGILRSKGLVTVCEEAHCPNMAECWHEAKTATFMVMGDTCTRGCRFCAVAKAQKGRPLDPDEPKKTAEAIAEMQLDYAVITSVDRDDLPDGGAGHFAAVITAVKKAHPNCIVEVLIPDFKGNKADLKTIVDARPEVIAHNVETVPSLQKIRDPRATFDQSLAVLRMVKEINPAIFTKSAFMVGLGETEEEMHDAMKALRSVGCDFLTIGQYLKPKNRQLDVKEYVRPELFAAYKEKGEQLGFLYVASGPFVRSSYRAGEYFITSIIKAKNDQRQTNNEERPLTEVPA